MSLSTLNPYRPSTALDRYRSRPRQMPSEDSVPQAAGDSVTLSAAAREPRRDGKKMAVWGAIGTAVGVAASLVIPGAGLGALLVGGLMGGVGGAAIADGALTDAGTRPGKSFDPYNPGDVLDPWNMTHPRNPFNPLSFPK